MGDYGKELIFAPIGLLSFPARLLLARQKTVALLLRLLALGNVQDQGQHGLQLARLIAQDRVVPLAVEQ